MSLQPLKGIVKTGVVAVGALTTLRIAEKALIPSEKRSKPRKPLF